MLEPTADLCATLMELPHTAGLVELALIRREMAQQARACIYGRLKEHITNTLTVDREVRRREAASGVVGGWRVGTIICRGLEPVL